jgi:hypothetical protein
MRAFPLLAELPKILRLGLGRGIIYARRGDLREFRDVILDACLRCYSYDIQVEGTRASYMYDLVGCLADKDFYYNEVLNSLAEGGDDWHAAERFEFAACLAFDGNEKAKQAMYDCYDPGPEMGEHIGIDFLRMDGIKGLLFVAEKMGALLMETPEGVNTGYFLSQSIEVCGEQLTWDALCEAATANPYIEKYKSVAAEGSRRPSIKPTGAPELLAIKYAELFNEVPSNKPYLLRKWGEQASDEELALAATGLIAATDSKDQLAHLRIFASRRYPLDVHTLVALVDIEENRVGLAAVKALARVRHQAVRDVAFRLIDTGTKRWRGEAVELLSENYEPGDHKIVLQWFHQEEDLQTLHSIGTGLIDFWKRHPDDETEVQMLRALYENGPCSVCRESAVKRLIERGALPEELRAECAWDANTDIRDLIGNVDT